MNIHHIYTHRWAGLLSLIPRVLDVVLAKLKISFFRLLLKNIWICPSYRGKRDFCSHRKEISVFSHPRFLNASITGSLKLLITQDKNSVAAAILINF